MVLLINLNFHRADKGMAIFLFTFAMDSLMANRLNILWNFISHYKYFLVIVVCTLLIGVVGEDSVLKHVRLELQIEDLKDEIRKYEKQHEADSKQLQEIRSNPKAIERIARERYFMKADDEDIFVLSSDELPVDENQESLAGNRK